MEERPGKNLWESVYTGSNATRKYLETEYAELKGVLTELGLVQ